MRLTPLGFLPQGYCERKPVNLERRHLVFYTRGVICRLCNKGRDQGQKGIGVRYRSCSDIQYKGKYGLRHLFIYSVHSSGVCKQ